MSSTTEGDRPVGRQAAGAGGRGGSASAALVMLALVAVAVCACAYVAATWRAEVLAYRASCAAVGGTYDEDDRTQTMRPMCRLRDGSFRAVARYHPRPADAADVLGSWVETGADGVARAFSGVVGTSRRHRASEDEAN